MTNEEFDKLCEELTAQGLDEKDILGVILKMFEDGKIDIEDMKKLAGARGYELTEEFLSKASGAGEGEAALAEEAPEDISSEEVEDAQEVDSDEAEDEDSEDEEAESTGEEEDTDEEDEEESEEDEKEKARKLYGLN